MTPGFGASVLTQMLTRQSGTTSTWGEDRDTGDAQMAAGLRQRDARACRGRRSFSS